MRENFAPPRVRVDRTSDTASGLRSAGLSGGGGASRVWRGQRRGHQRRQEHGDQSAISKALSPATNNVTKRDPDLLHDWNTLPDTVPDATRFSAVDERGARQAHQHHEREHVRGTAVRRARARGPERVDRHPAASPGRPLRPSGRGGNRRVPAAIPDAAASAAACALGTSIAPAPTIRRARPTDPTAMRAAR